MFWAFERVCIRFIDTCWDVWTGSGRLEWVLDWFQAFSMNFAIAGAVGIAHALVRCTSMKSTMWGLLRIYMNGGVQWGIAPPMCVDAKPHLRRGSRMGSVVFASHGSWMRWSHLRRVGRFYNTAPMQARTCEPFYRAYGVAFERLFSYIQHLELGKEVGLLALAYFTLFLRSRFHVAETFEKFFILTSKISNFNLVLIYYHDFS